MRGLRRREGRRRPGSRTLSEKGLAIVVRLLCWMICLSAPGVAGGGGTRDLGDGWLLPPGRVLGLLGAAGSSSRAPAWWVLMGQGRLYGLAELPLLEARGGWSSANWAVSGRYHRLGAELMRDEEWGLELRLQTRCSPGLEIIQDRLAIQGGPPSSRLRLRGGVDVPVGRAMAASLRMDLTDAPPWQGERAIQRWLLLQGTSRDLCWAIGLDRSADNEPWLELSLSARLCERAAAGLRTEPATGTVGLTTAWRAGGWLLRSSHLVHPLLGVTHRWQLGRGCLPARP
jgi:hypothetical protein